jgi:tetratricopeptide (TPR) repeat protein
MKRLLHLLMIGALCAGWGYYIKAQHDAKAKIAGIEKHFNDADADGDKLSNELDRANAAKDEKGFTGFLLAFLTAGYAGISFVVYVLPAIAHKFTHAIYDSGEEVEMDHFRDARAKIAQGDYEGAIEAFREGAASDPLNRMPWVEIARIQKEQLHDVAAAIQTLRGALADLAWHENDAAFLLFRLAELYDEGVSDRASAAAIFEQVIGQFPNTRHSANARHKLHEWGLV